MFKSMIERERIERQHISMFSHNHEGLEIRRDFILEDAFEKMYPQGENIKNRQRILFVDTNYITEDGVDGGGLSKEFLTKLTEAIFDPHFAFFTETP
jgi:ubiquitin-protein ligase E3 C